MSESPLWTVDNREILRKINSFLLNMNFFLIECRLKNIQVGEMISFHALFKNEQF